jgi:UTP--glucose-1-phosphate uridylyltransferase
MMKSLKGVIPAAGLGTRLLPLTKAQPKEMLPILDKPAIQYVVEEAAEAGINDILIISDRRKRALEDHFDRILELEVFLEKKDPNLLEEIRRISQIADIHYFRQKEPLGLGHAVYCARKFVGENPFAVLLGDVVFCGPSPLSKMIEMFENVGYSIVALERVPKNEVQKYGVVKVKKVGNDLLITDLVEKPKPKEAPSNLAIVGRYILTPKIFEMIEKTPPASNNEIQLTDSLKLLLQEEKIYAYITETKRFDIGNKLNWLLANLEFAMKDKSLRGPLISYFSKIRKRH